MTRLNNKGQALILFVLIIPIIIMVLALVYDGGTAIYEKEKLDSVNFIVIDYGLDNISTITESDLIVLALKNTSNISHIEVAIQDNEIKILTQKENKNILGKFINLNIFQITSEYQGKIIDDKKKIERIK